MDWVRLLPFVTGMVDQELLARNEYLAAENRILKAAKKDELGQNNDFRKEEVGKIHVAIDAKAHRLVEGGLRDEPEVVKEKAYTGSVIGPEEWVSVRSRPLKPATTSTQQKFSASPPKQGYCTSHNSSET
jgi:hypothetical protein